MRELFLIDEALRPMRPEIDKCKEIAHLSSTKMGFMFMTILSTQFALVQYGTYIAFSWDIMEPIAACLTLSDAVAVFWFWSWAGKPWNLDSIRSFFYERKF